MTQTLRAVQRAAPPLSCYTTNLVVYLDAVRPEQDAAAKLAEAISLSVRTDLPDGTLAFSHHARIDDNALSYRGSPDWAGARSAIARELADTGMVIAVGNGRHLPWSPHFQHRDIAHWILITGRHDERESGDDDGDGGGGWEIADYFDALLPSGPQRPYHGRLRDAELRAAMTPLGRQEPHHAHRDTYALGTASPTGSADHFRWLRHSPPPPPPPPLSSHTDESQSHPPGQTWVHEPLTVLHTLSDRLTSDDRALSRHADDLWAAARHHCHRITTLAAAGRVDPAAADALVTSWSQLPRALRFAADSAARGRRRDGVAARAFDDLVQATARAGVC